MVKPLRVALMLTALLLPGVAHASDFGCLAEWLDLTAVVLALPAAAVLGMLAMWLAPVRTFWLAALSWMGCAGVIGLTTCTYGNDQDGLALAAVTLAFASPVMVAALRHENSETA